jgi:hypothetical protein
MLFWEDPHRAPALSAVVPGAGVQIRQGQRGNLNLEDDTLPRHGDIRETGANSAFQINLGAVLAQVVG